MGSYVEQLVACYGQHRLQTLVLVEGRATTLLVHKDISLGVNVQGFFYRVVC